MTVIPVKEIRRWQGGNRGREIPDVPGRVRRRVESGQFFRDETDVFRCGSRSDKPAGSVFRRQAWDSGGEEKK